MKKFQDVLNAQQKYYFRRQQYLDLNVKFYLNLVNQISTKGDIPKGGY